MKYKEVIEKMFDKRTGSKNIHEAVLIVENSSGDFYMDLGYGGRDKQSPIFLASVSKLFVTACILILQEQKKLSLNNHVGDYVEKTILDGIHTYKGKDYSQELKLSDLLFQTSGLPYGLECFAKQLSKKDIEITLEDALQKVKASTPHFAPNTGKRANYSDINFRLLCHIIEKVTNLPLAKVYQEYICNPLGLAKTYLPTKSDDFIPDIYYKSKILKRPKFFSSSNNYDAISTANDLMRFLKAFWGGTLFSRNVFEKLSIYKKLQFPMGLMYYGGGYMQIPLGNITTLFMGKGELIGHAGSTGSLAFYYPQKDLFFVGDFNQMADPGIPIRFIMRLAMALK